MAIGIVVCVASKVDWGSILTMLLTVVKTVVLHFCYLLGEGVSWSSYATRAAARGLCAGDFVAHVITQKYCDGDL